MFWKGKAQREGSALLRDRGVNTMTSRVKESGWGCLGKQDSLQFSVWIVGFDMGFLGYLGWNFCFGVWNELRAERNTGRRREGRRKQRALWNSHKLASCSLASLIISLSTSLAWSISSGRDCFLIKLRFTGPGPSLGNVLRKCSWNRWLCMFSTPVSTSLWPFLS